MLPDRFTPAFLRQVELLRIRARRSFLGTKQGGHVSLRKGHGIEFSDYRKYELGDNPRHIDWGVFGRSDKLFVKRFHEEEDLSVLLVLDASTSMTNDQNIDKWNTCRDLGLALSYTALMEQDTISCSVPGAFHKGGFSGAKAIHSLARDLSNPQVSKNHSFSKEMHIAAAKIRTPGKAIVISDFLMELAEIERAFNILRSKNLDIAAIQIISDGDKEPYQKLDFGTFIDSETDEVVNVSLDPENRALLKELFQEHNQKLQSYFLGSQIQYTSINTQEDLLQFIINNLTLLGLLKRN